MVSLKSQVLFAFWMFVGMSWMLYACSDVKAIPVLYWISCICFALSTVSFWYNDGKYLLSKN